jgi:outer membrane protein assembly factor BamE
MRIFSTLRFSIIFLAILCASCGTALPTIKPYKLDVQQGNVVTSKMLLQLRPGMTKSQVRFIMGTPLIQDSFHGNRWDYVYQMREKGKITEQRRVILDFEGDSLKTVRGDVIPKGSELKADEGAANSGTRVINPTSKPAEKGVLDKLKFWKKDEADLARETEAAKAKLEADEAAKNAAEKAKENADKQTATPIEEPQSIMAVPLEALPMADVPVSPQAVDPVKAPEPVAEKKLEKKSELAPDIAPEEIKPTKIAPLLVNSSEAKVQKATETEIVEKEPQISTVQKIEEKTSGVVNDSVKTPLAVESFESTSGMKFDKNLKLAEESEPAESVTTSEVQMPRAGNKTVPKPKDLPAESKPGFFDRMLEKIGF